MSGHDDVDRAADLVRLERWWRETDNPLFIWEALAKCLNNDAPEAPLPTFCREYLKDASFNMTLLGWGRDFRSSADPKPRISSKQAYALAVTALGLGHEASKNMFDRVLDAKETMRFGLDAEYYGDDEAKGRIQRTRSVGDDRATRILQWGRRLIGLSGKPQG